MEGEMLSGKMEIGYWMMPVGGRGCVCVGEKPPAPRTRMKIGEMKR